jgi:hypothetical protein
MSDLTVKAANDVREAATGTAKAAFDLIECCLNAEAAFQMLGFKVPKRRGGFLPVGVQTLVQITDLLATMPEQADLVRTSMAFSCELCGKAAEISSDDCWFCDACVERANGEAQP